MEENKTTYPMSPVRKGEYDVRYLPVAGKDMVKHRPLHEIMAEEKRAEFITMSDQEIPVIFLLDVQDADDGTWIGRKHETVYVSQEFMRNELFPQRFALYATPDNYRLLGLPEHDHHIHGEIAHRVSDLERIRSKQMWDEEPWRYSFDFLFRKWANGPPELLGEDEPWDGEEPSETSSARSDSGDKKSTFVQKRKAKKIKLF